MAMQQQGLRLKSPLGDIHLMPVRATENPADIGPVDVVVFAVKLYDIESASAAIMPLVGPNTRVVTFQNGIDSVNFLSRFVPWSQVVGGAAYVSAYIECPGVIVHAGGMTTATVGGHDDAMIKAFGDACMRAGGLEIKIVEDIEKEMWIKFVALSAFSRELPA